MTPRPEVLDFYRQPVWMTDPGSEGAGLLASLPGDPVALARRIQALLLHEHWAGAYGQTLSPERRGGSQLRSVREMLERLRSVEPRPAEERLVGICRHYSVFAAAALRSHGVPARA